MNVKDLYELESDEWVEALFRELPEETHEIFEECMEEFTWGLRQAVMLEFVLPHDLNGLESHKRILRDVLLSVVQGLYRWNNDIVVGRQYRRVLQEVEKAVQRLLVDFPEEIYSDSELVKKTEAMIEEDKKQVAKYKASKEKPKKKAKADHPEINMVEKEED